MKVDIPILYSMYFDTEAVDIFEMEEFYGREESFNFLFIKKRIITDILKQAGASLDNVVKKNSN